MNCGEFRKILTSTGRSRQASEAQAVREAQLAVRKSGREDWGISVRSKVMAEGLSKSLQPYVSPEIERNMNLEVNKEEETYPGNTAGRKAPPVLIRGK